MPSEPNTRAVRTSDPTFRGAFVMPSSDIVFLLEDDPARLGEMLAVLREVLPRVTVHVEDDCQAAIDWLMANQAAVSLISLDHDLDSVVWPNDPAGVDHGCGRPVADYLATQSPTCPVIVHTSNAVAGDGMFYALQRSGWPVHRVYPFDHHAWVAKEWRAMLLELIAGGWLRA
jgi:hypothetical protein